MKDDLEQILILGLGILLSLLVILGLNDIGFGSGNWQTIAQNMGYISVALMFFGMGLFVISRR